MRVVRFVGLVVVVLGVALAGGYLYFLNFSPDRQRFPVRGIDVSHHQGVIDWGRVAADDVGFAYIKVTEGGDHIDTRQAENLEGARAAGVAVGAYHFFTLCRPGAEQAENFLRFAPRHADALPPAVDLEYEGNCSARPAAADVRRELDAFLGPVEAALGKQAVFYVTYGFYEDYYAELPERPLWTRWIAWQPPNDEWLLWQYHDRGRVDGITGDVDLNVLQGGPDVLAGMQAGS